MTDPLYFKLPGTAAGLEGVSGKELPPSTLVVSKRMSSTTFPRDSIHFFDHVTFLDDLAVFCLILGPKGDQKNEG